MIDNIIIKISVSNKSAYSMILLNQVNALNSIIFENPNHFGVKK